MAVDIAGIAVVRCVWRGEKRDMCEEAETWARRDGAAVGAGCFSEGRGKLASEFQQLVDGERQDTKHEMCHDLAGPAHSDEARPELVFQAAVHAFDHGA